MYVCICNAVTDRAIHQAVREGVTTVDELSRRTGCGDCCGSCVDLAGEMLDDALRSRAFAMPLIAIAA
ncbi:MAG: bacterioferritin-associated ferredoxin [Rhodanobacteraceae bacterium]